MRTDGAGNFDPCVKAFTPNVTEHGRLFFTALDTPARAVRSSGDPDLGAQGEFVRKEALDGLEITEDENAVVDVDTGQKARREVVWRDGRRCRPRLPQSVQMTSSIQGALSKLDSELTPIFEPSEDDARSARTAKRRKPAPHRGEDDDTPCFLDYFFLVVA